MKDLLKNIASAKREIGAISKDSKNPFFKSKYFDINQLLEHVEPILFDKGLFLTQPILDNKVYSILWDIETGDKFESYLELPLLNDPQKLGSCITYYRRYTLSSLLAIQSEDDDGNKASKPQPKKKPVLERDSDKWNKAVQTIKDGVVTVEQVLKAYATEDEQDEKFLRMLKTK